MAKKGSVKQVFPGGNTCKGFFSFYDYILPQDEANKIFVIKGGPGVGKSTFMKKIASEIIDKGYDVEFMHCSSDNNSLDGVVIPALKIALLDGTAPHVVDPKNPGAVDEIINLGICWNEEDIRTNRENIITANKEVGKLFSTAYKYLAAAKCIYDNRESIITQAVSKAKMHKEVGRMINNIFNDIHLSDEIGKERHLFASAITPEGVKNYLPTIINIRSNVYIIRGFNSIELNKFFLKIAQASIERGFLTEFYHCAFNPERIEHIVIPELDTAITTSNEYHSCRIDNPAEIIEVDDYLDDSIINKYENIMEYDRNEFNSLLNQAVNIISKAKAVHDYMERFYIPNMNFDKVQRIWDETFEKILKYAETDK